MKSRFSIAVAVVLLLMSGNAGAQQVVLGGQVRPRFEGRAGDGFENGSTSMRTRLSLTAALPAHARAFVQFQDVRVWGEEAGTIAAGDNVDLHQAFIDFGGDSTTFALRVGRQEAAYGEERLVGAADWIQNARSFDGARLSVNVPSGFADVIAFQITDASVQETEEMFVGGYSTLHPTTASTVDLYVLNNRSTGARDMMQTTLGARVTAAHGPLSYRAESAFQSGSRGENDVRAYIAAGRITLHAFDGKAQLSVWYDRLSGDDEPADDTERVFDTLFATNHKFYGLADVFTNIPLHTAGYGLQDAAIKIGYAIHPSTDAGLDLHHMRAAADVPLASDAFANEVDLTLTHRIAPGLSVLTGLAGVRVLPGLRALRPDQQSHVFGYLMLNAVF